MNPSLLDLDLPTFAGEGFPPPMLTLEAWLDWTDWCRRRLVKPEHFERWVNDERRRPVDVPFVLP